MEAKAREAMSRASDLEAEKNATVTLLRKQIDDLQVLNTSAERKCEGLTKDLEHEKESHEEKVSHELRLHSLKVEQETHVERISLEEQAKNAKLQADKLQSEWDHKISELTSEHRTKYLAIVLELVAKSRQLVFYRQLALRYCFQKINQFSRTFCGHDSPLNKASFSQLKRNSDNSNTNSPVKQNNSTPRPAVTTENTGVQAQLSPEQTNSPAAKRGPKVETFVFNTSDDGVVDRRKDSELAIENEKLEGQIIKLQNEVNFQKSSTRYCLYISIIAWNFFSKKVPRDIACI